MYFVVESVVKLNSKPFPRNVASDFFVYDSELLTRVLDFPC